MSLFPALRLIVAVASGLLPLLLMTAAAADPACPAAAGRGVTAVRWGKTPQGAPVTLYTLTNKNGVSVSIMDYGATIVRILVPDRNGKMADVVLGYDSVTPYFHGSTYFGATPGRYANRIANGQFSFAKDTLHGGIHGFDRYVWKTEAVDSDEPALRLTLLSPDGDQGFPGNLFASVTYTLSDANELRMDYEATTDKATVINLTNHAYFNLKGAGEGSILDHIVTLYADSYIPVNATLIPTGVIAPVAGTPFDFLNPTPIGLHLREAGGHPVGFDNCFVLKKGFFSKWALAAEVDEPTTGRTLKVFTDQPGLQFYTGNSLTGAKGKDEKPYHGYNGFCLESEHYPDSPNQPNFPSTLLLPGDTYKTSTVYQFGTK